MTLHSTTLHSTTLHSTTLGEAGSPVAFCHGLLGQGKNWSTIAKQLATTHRVRLLDMPYHGRSAHGGAAHSRAGWPERFDYIDAAERVAEAIADLGPVALVGHSMGGKIAMLVALRHADLVERLCVVDIAPVSYPQAQEFGDYLDAMLAIDLATLESRSEADAELSHAVPSPMIRGFLLQNLRRETGPDGTSWCWLANLEVLRRDLAALASWPAAEVEGTTYGGRVLWIGGARSDYIGEHYLAAMEALFPRTRQMTIKDAGHWVHSDQPAVFAEALRLFIDASGAARVR